LVCIDDLHAEPICRNAVFVMELERRGDGAIDIVPAYVDDAQGGVGEGGEGIWEEIKVI
jgi:hypothetical protein